ncbi:enoyl-CoA hydratase/isomerase family protein [Novosphingobium album (ex Liu et al. 2023)]|uniref:Enoyl-CoA hydratase/isomerase family protein n=1 Tax=Novosphingobium album (ex Liu et al. 2023) TaxID=3031130 RepID=A0ABT5WK89_9SPHN|nr:enoyl-CoA hydratase/isomerase family protein [Novosphingobium album (ex Liu et al. 2023)]MDE8650450.1 enoyl-CoA hydratase/isomerase family protein [Novosphingobium album (ex Liu et al. 2023)]
MSASQMSARVMSARVTRSDSEGLCTLMLNRPDKRNALDRRAFEELDAHCAALEGETATIGCVVLRGKGPVFCAGADIAELGPGFTDSAFRPHVIERLARLPQPVIAAVHGLCFTGGLELALAADLIVAERGARFADTHGKWGLVGAWGMTQRLPRRVGLATAKRLMFTASPIDAGEAATIGLVDVLAEEGGLDAAVATLTGDILANSWHTNIATKRLLGETDGLPLAEGLAHEHYRYPGFAPDHAERIAAFSRR